MKRVLIFLLGAATGSLITYKIVEKKYIKIMEQEIEDFKEYCKQKLDNMKVELNLEKPEKDFEMKTTEYPDGRIVNESVHYKNKIEELGYGAGMDAGDNEEDYTVKIEPQVEHTKPYVISPEEYGATEYEMISLTLYADGVLVEDDEDAIIDNPEMIIGDTLKHFGQFEDDALHVRDENNECDYEILKSEKNYYDLIKEEE